MNLSPRLVRLINLLVVAGTGTVLGLSGWLTPSTEGHSTHLQLGLKQCTFLTLTHYPCPMCGMTTTFAHMAHGHLLSAIVTQPFGVVLFSMTVFSFVVSLLDLIQPRERWTRILDRLAPWETWLAAIFLIGMGLGWLYKIAVMRG